MENNRGARKLACTPHANKKKKNKIYDTAAVNSQYQHQLESWEVLESFNI